MKNTITITDFKDKKELLMEKKIIIVLIIRRIQGIDQLSYQLEVEILVVIVLGKYRIKAHH